MDSGLYAAYTALLSRTNALDLAANNLANTSTAGFHAGRSSFRSLLAEAQDSLPSQVGTAVNSFGLVQGANISTLQGQIQSTGNPLDLAVQGTGYFAVKTSAGTRYTRDGEFQVSPAGVLQTKTGASVLDASGNAINVPSGNVSVAGDGTLSVSTAQGSMIVGRVAMMELGPNIEAGESPTLYKAADGATPQVSTASSIQQGALESSNLDATQGTVQLLSIQRQAEMMQRALSVFHNDFDKTASEDLARV